MKQFKWAGKYSPSGDVTLSLLTAPTVQAQTEGFPQPAAPNNQGVSSNVQQASIAAGGSLATVQVGTDENPRFTAKLGSATAGVQAGSVTPQAGGPSVPQPTRSSLASVPRWRRPFIPSAMVCGWELDLARCPGGRDARGYVGVEPLTDRCYVYLPPGQSRQDRVQVKGNAFT